MLIRLPLLKADNILDQTSGYLVEVSHISSFLQKCEMHEIQIMPYQQNLFLECQQLCKKIKKSFDQIIKWVIQTKKHLNEIKCPITNEAHLDNCFKQSLDKNAVSEDLFKAYQQVRGVLKDIHKEAMLLDPKNMINHAGKRLEVMQGKSLFIETEHEMNILCDYGLFQYRENEKNIVERYYDLHHELYSDQKLAILRAYKQAQFSFLEIVKPIVN